MGNNTSSTEIQNFVFPEIVATFDFSNLNDQPEENIKNIAWLVNALKSIEETLKNIDIDKQYKAIEDTLEFLNECTNVLLQVANCLYPPAAIWLGEIKQTIMMIRNKMRQPSVKNGIKAFMRYAVGRILQLLYVSIKHLENNPDAIRKLDENLGKYINILQKSFTKDMVKAVVSSGLTSVAFLAGANILLPILGFGAEGILAGSIAASVMGPQVAAGSLFAILQSAGVVGFSAAATGGIALAGIAAGGVVFGVYKFVERVKEIKEKDELEKSSQRIAQQMSMHPPLIASQ